MTLTIVFVIVTTTILLALCAIIVKVVNAKDERKMPYPRSANFDYQPQSCGNLLSTLHYECEQATKKMDLLFSRAGVIMGAFTAFYAFAASSTKFSSYALLHMSKWINLTDSILHIVCYTGIASCCIAELLFIYVMFGNRFISNRVPRCFTEDKFNESTYINLLLSDITRIHELTSARLKVFQLAISVSSYGTILMFLPYILSMLFLDFNY